MKHLKIIIGCLLPAFLTGAVFAKGDVDPGQICISVGRFLEQGHYTKRKLDDSVSKEFLTKYLDFLDYNHLFLTQEDVAKFEAEYLTTLDNEIMLGNPQPAYKIFDYFLKKVEDRVKKNKELIKKDYKFDSQRTVILDRQKVPRPKDEVEADDLWQRRIEGELLQEKLNEHPIDPPQEVVTRRYDQILRNLREQTREDVVSDYLSVLAQAYDPHSEYLSKSELENFAINMRLSLVGIGAVLQSNDGYAKIMDLVPGGPAELGGNLKVNDRITAVAQGEEPFVDVIGMKLDKVVEMIRGKKGTKVRLQVVPSDAADPSARKVVEIIRDEVQLKEQFAKADIIETQDSKGRAKRVGWLTLPSFYADMDAFGAKDARSLTSDVQRLLKRLKKEGINGLVVDLRRDGGGSLTEAVKLTGLFIDKGPVVQSKDSNGREDVLYDSEAGIMYDGPMVVLTNRLSASASEIFAAAMQDYQRAVIVGDSSSFGKGTVQQLLEIGRVIPFLGSNDGEAGALKMTIQKFYRVAGGSTQLKGVVSDIKIPSLYDHPEIGEAALKDPLPYDVVTPLKYQKANKKLFIEELKKRSTTRVSKKIDFRYIEEDLGKVREKIAQNEVSLNEKERRAEIAENKKAGEKRTAERKSRKKPNFLVYEITLDNVDKPELQLVKYEEKKKSDPKKEKNLNADDEEMEEDEKDVWLDPIRNETVAIAGDLIEFNSASETATAKK